MTTWRDELLTERERLLLTDADGLGIEEWAGFARKMADRPDLVDIPEVSDGSGFPWCRDITNELAHNDDCPGLLKDGWWQRRVDQIDYVTIHHTYGSNSPQRKAGGRACRTLSGSQRPARCYCVMR